MSEQSGFRQLKCGDWAYCVDAFVCDVVIENSEPKVGLLAVLSKDMQAYANRGEGTLVVQFDRLVKPGMILTRHVFQGLRRPLRTDGDSDSDQRMLVHTRKPSYDYSWGGRGTRIIQHNAPPARVFGVLVNANFKHREKYPEVDGWVNAWTWIEEDPGLPEAPIGWVDRYDKKLWTRKDM